MREKLTLEGLITGGTIEHDGYIRIPHFLLEHPLWTTMSANECRMMLYFLRTAAYKPMKGYFLRNTFMLARGQLVTTIRSLEEELTMSHQSVRTAMKGLVGRGLIKKGVTQCPNGPNESRIYGRRTLISICRPELYLGKIG